MCEQWQYLIGYMNFSISNPYITNQALESELEKLRDQIEQENAIKGDVQKQLSRAVAETQIWKSKYTTEALARCGDDYDYNGNSD